MRGSLRTYVAVATVAAVAATLALVLVVVVSTFAGSERRALDERLVERAAATASASGGPPAVQPAPPPGGRPGPPAGLPPLSRRIEQTVAQGGESARLLRDGAVVGTYGAELPDPRFPSPSGSGSVESVRVGGLTYRAIAVEAAVTADDGQRYTARLELAASLDDVEGRISDLRRRVLLVGLAGLVVATGLALLLVRVALRSLERLRGGIAMVRDPDEPGARLVRGGTREVDEVAATINAMLDRTAAAGAARGATLEASRRFAADAGHELRTPLAAISANVATLRAHRDLGPAEHEAILDALAEDEQRLVALLEALQALARADAAEAVPREPVDVAELVDASVLAARRRHPLVTVTLHAPDGDAATVEGWADGLRLAIDNLLTNAILHGGGAAVAVTIDAPGDGTATVTVDDAGPGIPPTERSAVRGRFVRGAAARGPGSGLGLALVSQQAELHGGALEIGTSPTGGAQVRLRLGRPA